MTVLQSMQEAQRGINTILQYCFWGENIHLSVQKAFAVLRDNYVSSFHLR